jgi:hypothetical protein
MRKALMFWGIIFVVCSLNNPAAADYYSRQFSDMDANYDDYVDFDEYRYYILGATVDAFRKIDTSKDEKIDFFEWIADQESQYPFKSGHSFTYKGKSGIWKVDGYGNRYKDAYGSYYGHRCNFWLGYQYNRWHDHWPRHHHGYFWGH